MKEFLKQKFNIIIICVTIMVLGIAGFSFAYASNENIIYTRDELSEMVTDLSKKGSRAYLNATSSVTLNNISALSPVNIDNCLISDDSIYSCVNNNKIKINKTGMYNVTIMSTLVFSDVSKGGYLVVKYNSDTLGLKCEANSYLYKTTSCSVSFPYYLLEGDLLSLSYVFNGIVTVYPHLTLVSL